MRLPSRNADVRGHDLDPLKLSLRRGLHDLFDDLFPFDDLFDFDYLSDDLLDLLHHDPIDGDFLDLGLGHDLLDRDFLDLRLHHYFLDGDLFDHGRFDRHFLSYDLRLATRGQGDGGYSSPKHGGQTASRDAPIALRPCHRATSQDSGPRAMPPWLTTSTGCDLSINQKRLDHTQIMHKLSRAGYCQL